MNKLEISKQLVNLTGDMLPDDFSLDVDVFESGVFDSFTFIQFIGEVENHFNFNFEQDDFTDNKLKTLNDFVDLIHERI